MIDELSRLPGIGQKSAQRLAFYLLKRPKEDALRLARAIEIVREKITVCERCFTLATEQYCSICRDPLREPDLVCVVEGPQDLVAIEKAHAFSGLYHVLGGSLNPLDGIGPDQLRVRELLARVQSDSIKEIIVCTNPNLEGDTTAMYLARLLQPLGIRVTRIASGLPVGGDLEYADELTLERAIAGRQEVVE